MQVISGWINQSLVCSKVKILITGVSGFIGSYLAAFFQSQSYEVFGTTSRTFEYCKYSGCRMFYNVRLGTSIPESALSNYDFVIHASYDQTEGNALLNYNGTLTWVEQLKNAGSKRQVLLSSCSAHPDSPSEYGKLKCALEYEFLAQGLDVVRLGLVIGDGGLFAVIQKVLCLPVTIALTGVTIQLISVQLVAQALLNMLETSPVAYPVGLYYDRSFTMIELAKLLQKESFGQNSCKAGLVLPIPVGFVSSILNLLSMFSSDTKRFAKSLSALRHSSHLSFQSDLARLGLGKHNSFVDSCNAEIANGLKEQADE